MAANIGDALKMIPSESLDRVEVITNPSARYEAEGGAGIINIILKKGSNAGINGSVTANVGDPTSYGANATVNYREDKFNLYSSLGYAKNKTFGNSLNESQYFDENGNTSSFVDEYSRSTRERESINGNIGLDYNLTDKLTWTNISDLQAWSSPLIVDFQIKGIPTSYLVDGNGKIIAKNLRGKDLEVFLTKTLN